MSSFYKNNNLKDVEYETADQFALAFIVQPNVITKTVELYCTVELSGQKTRGQLICDYNGVEKKCPNVVIVTEVNQNLYMELLHNALK